MRALVLALPLLAGLATAQPKATAVDYGQGYNAYNPDTFIPLPAFSTTYSSSYTRGLYFQVPAPMIVIGLQVPDETKNGLQNVAVYRLTAKPPAYSATVASPPIFYQEAIPSSTVIQVNPPLIFQPGEWFGVIGACGNATTTQTSYAASGPFTSNVLGQPITIYRLLMQANLVATKGNFALSSEDAFNVGRVKIFVAGQRAPAPVLATTALPVLGTTAALSLLPNDSTASAGLVILGARRSQTPTPFGELLVAPPFYFTFLVAGAGGAVNLPVPNNQALLGAGPLDFQGFFVLPQGFATSNGTEWFLGN